jgi:hypothetical protein
MTTRQFLALQSAKSTLEKLRKHERTYAHNAGLIEQVAKFNEVLAQVTRLAREQAAASDGLTAENSKARENLIDTLPVLTGIGEGWAAAAGHESLRSRLTTNRTELTALGLRLEVNAPVYLEAAREAGNLGAERFGMTEKLLGQLSTQIEQLAAAPTVRGVRDERKTVTQELSDALVEMMAFLSDVLDPLMRAFLLTAPRFYEEYRNSRRIGGRRSGTDKEGEVDSTLETPAEVPAGTGLQMASQGLVVDEDAEADAALEAALTDKETTAANRNGSSVPVNGAELVA